MTNLKTATEVPESWMRQVRALALARGITEDEAFKRLKEADDYIDRVNDELVAISEPDPYL